MVTGTMELGLGGKVARNVDLDLEILKELTKKALRIQ